MEHITTRDAAEFVAAAPPSVAASVTPQHLLLNRNALFVGGLRPHAFCLPILKREEQRAAVAAAATSGSRKFFLGTDSGEGAGLGGGTAEGLGGGMAEGLGAGRQPLRAGGRAVRRSSAASRLPSRLGAACPAPLLPQRRTPSTPRRARAGAPACSRRPWRCRCMRTPLSRRARCSTSRPLPRSTAPTFTAYRATRVGGGWGSRGGGDGAAARLRRGFRLLTQPPRAVPPPPPRPCAPTDKVTLRRQPWIVPGTYTFGDSEVVPMWAGQECPWRVVEP